MATFKQYLITEKLNRTEFNQILSNPKFLIGMEFEYYDDNIQNSDGGESRLYSTYDELVADVERSVQSRADAEREAIREGDEIIQRKIVELEEEKKELEAKLEDLDEDDEEYEEVDEDIVDHDDEIERLNGAKGDYANFESVNDLVDIEHEHEYEQYIEMPYIDSALIDYWSNYSSDAEDIVKQAISSAIWEEGNFEYELTDNGIGPISQDMYDETYGEGFEETVENSFDFESFPFKNYKITEEENFKIWRIMQDGSLGFGGIEITSPVMSLKDGLNAMDMMFDYIRDNGHTIGAEEDEGGETGFHVNLSYKNYDMSKLDIFKMILFMEEQYVSESFPYRHAAEYIDYVMPGITGAAKKTNLSKETIAFKRKLEGLRGKIFRAITPPTPGKSFGINASGAKGKKGRVEFRYLGGEDYHRKGAIIRQQILRFAYMLELGMNPEFKKNEYIKKMTRFIEKAGKNKTYINATKEYTAFDSVVTDRDGFIYRRDGDWVYQYKNGGFDKKGKELPDVKLQRIPLKRMNQMKKLKPDFYDGEFAKPNETI